MGRTYTTLILLVLFILAAMASSAQADDACVADSPYLIHCGATPSAFITPDGSVWAVFEYRQHAWITHSNDGGDHFAPAVQVTEQPEAIETNGENRPKLIVDPDGQHVYVSWTLKTEGQHTGDIRFTRSTDGGRHFEPVRTINDDGLLTSHRFDSMLLTESGLLYLTWLDKRELEYAAERGESYRGSAVFYSYSADQGASFSANRRIADHSCECCRIAVAPHGDDGMALLWRHVFDQNTRDHAISTVNRYHVGDMVRASHDDWHIDACPHHGPSMVVSTVETSYHISWFSAGNINRGIYYGFHSLEDGKTTRVRQVDGRPGAGHPSLGSFNDRLHLVWKRFNGIDTDLMLTTSDDEGHHWSDEQIIANTTQASDHPIIVPGPDGLMVSWMTQDTGYRLVRIDDSTASGQGEILPFTADSFEEIKQEYTGQSFLLALWSVHCPPCMIELEMLGRMLAEDPSIPLVLISTDPIDMAEDALDFLLDYDLAHIRSWMFADSFTERLRYSIDPMWFGELPRSYFFDAEHQHEAHSGILQESQVRSWLAR